MGQARVLVLAGRSLMLQGLLRWLREQEGIEAGGVNVLEPEAREHIGRFAPNAIIVDQQDLAANGTITVSELIRDYPDAKVIQVDPESNALSIVRPQRVEVAGAEDLLRLLRVD